MSYEPPELYSCRHEPNFQPLVRGRCRPGVDGGLRDGRARAAQAAKKAGEWPTYGGDLASTRYSPLDQINADNFNKLQLAFRFKTENLGPRPEFLFQGTPLMANGVLYVTGGTRRAAVAIDATTGEMLWMHSLNEGKRGEAAPRQLSGRGLSVLDRRQGRTHRLRDARLPDGRAQRQDRRSRPDLRHQRHRRLEDRPRSGRPRPDHGGDRPACRADHREGHHRRSARPIAKAARRAARPTSRATSAASTSAPASALWVFHTIPMKGEAGYETWDPDAQVYTGNTGVWAQMSADEELGIVYMPVELPTGDYYGGHRRGGRRRAGVVAVFREPASRSTSRPASASGTTSWCTTASGITTFRARRS